jgi:hypothetical protein
MATNGRRLRQAGSFIFLQPGADFTWNLYFPDFLIYSKKNVSL